jgi:hypothetical protein
MFPFSSYTSLPLYQFPKIHVQKPRSGKSAALSGTLLSVVRKVFFAGNLIFDGNVTQEVVGGLGYGAVTKECGTGRRILMWRISTPLRTYDR